jgi:hypothetical protein
VPVTWLVPDDVVVPELDDELDELDESPAVDTAAVCDVELCWTTV